MSSKSTTRLANWKRLDGIDLLRGLAIFLVLMNHVNMRLRLAGVPYTKGLPHQLASSLFWSGQLGVQMFFAASGFLITSITLRRWRPLSQIKVRDFYLLRFARIAPLLLLLLAVLSGLHLAHVRDFVVSAKTGGLGRAVFAALTFHVNVIEARHGYLPASWDILWSLSVEEMFYLFFPLLCWVFGQGKLFITTLLIFVVLGPLGRTVFAGSNEIWQEYSYLGGMDAIALGCLTALLVAQVRFSRRTLHVLGERRAGDSGAEPGLLELGLPLWFGPHRTGHDATGRRNVYVDCRRRANAVDESAFAKSAAEDRPIQLRSLSNAYVRSLRPVRFVCHGGQANALDTHTVRPYHSSCRHAGKRGCASLLGADEPAAARSYWGWTRQLCIGRGFPSRDISESRLVDLSCTPLIIQARMQSFFARRTSWNLATNRYTEALEAHRRAGREVLDLTASNPTTIGLHYREDELLRALAQREALIYEPQPKGLLAAREAIAGYYAERGTHISPDDLILTTSTSEAYSFVFRLLCDPGDAVLVPTPSYPLFDFLADLQDVKLFPYELVYDHGWQMDFPSLQAAIERVQTAGATCRAVLGRPSQQSHGIVS